MLFYAIPLNAKLSLWYNKQIVIIYLLAGKLLDLFTEGSILAHELMHGWLRLKGIFSIFWGYNYYIIRC